MSNWVIIIALNLSMFFPAIGNTDSYPVYFDTDIFTELKLEVLKKKDRKADSTFISKSFKDEPLPVIFFAVNNRDEAFKEVKKWGGTHVHRYGMGKSIERDQAFFDRAEKYELKVMSDLRGRYWLKENVNRESFHEYINHFKEHPALGFWYLCDEPDNKGFTSKDLKPFYELIQEETSRTPVALSHAWTENWYKYGNVQDIFMYNNYPIYSESYPEGELKAWTNFTENVINQGKKHNDPVIPVVQIFNWKVYGDDGQGKYRNYSVQKLRYPNSAELRYMVFASIALGARGLSLFSYANSKKIKPRWGDQVLSPVIKEAKELAKQVGDIKAKKEYSFKKENLTLTSWSNDKSNFIVLVNTTSSAHEFQFLIDRKIDNIGDYKLWGETRTTVKISLEGNKFIVNKMKPWEVIILKRSKN